MTYDDKAGFAEIMLGMAEAFGAELSKPGLKMWFRALSEFSIDEIHDAAISIMRSRKYTGMPTPAEFLEHLPGYVKPMDVEHKAQLQAMAMVDHLRRHGAGSDPDYDDPITKQLMATRWPYPRWAQTLTERETKWWVKEFVEAYVATHCHELKVIECAPRLKQLTAGIGR